ncbi:hypothetical protein DEO72_LG6g845 [Vigna unguiculata]|uniref:Uncharacterized protein n=1 Tax=Vigna unguiculata TaxID=3917 RepID=A0A4D6M5W5_VIGUN|nr:hypothetical protein DEO72_LG6g845 [Vigna unguiculata]
MRAFDFNIALNNLEKYVYREHVKESGNFAAVEEYQIDICNLHMLDVILGLMMF